MHLRRDFKKNMVQIIEKYIAKYIDTGHSDVSEADNFLILESMKTSNNLITIEEAVSNYLSKYKDISYARRTDEQL